MLQTLANAHIYKSFLDTAILFAVISIIYFIIRIILLRKATKTKVKKKIVARLNYIFILLFLAFIAKIWINGFTQLFYALSLVSAGLVVSNKETIMNFVGWIVITWRGIFAEGDYIQIGNNSGFVYELGILYFKVLQTSDNFKNTISGKMIKIPNGLIITNPVINYSLSRNLIETTQSWLFTPESDIELATTILQKQTEDILLPFYQRNELFSLAKLKPIFARKMRLDVRVKMNICFDSPSGIKLTICYYCLPKDHDLLDKKILLAIYTTLKQHNNIHIAFSD